MCLEDAWHARPQLFFKCLLRPRDGRPPKNPSWTRGPDDMEVCLVFFSTFEELKFPSTGPMDRATTKLYKPSPTLILYVASCDLMLGRVPLFPCFLRVRGQPMAVAVWAREASPGGSDRVRDRGKARCGQQGWVEEGSRDPPPPRGSGARR